MAVILETSLGDITIDLYTEERPRCCLNFLKLCKVKYYNYCLFHSVQKNLVAQTGDPKGSGKGGESIYMRLYGEQARYFEMETSPRIKHKKRGTVSMVNNGNGMHGSQFFMTLGENLDYLDGVHTVFGEVAEGLDVLDKINEAFCDKEHRPYRDIRIYHTIILDDPSDDPSGLEIPDRSPEPTKEQLDSGRIADDEEIDDTKDKSQEEVKEMVEEKEARANAQLLEMIGDIPDVECKPPDNVLFVCKLNPVTTAEDLEIIFSRFGTIVSCEVIKDQKTGESLQYAFIEFEKAEECENAYFKMDNVLIDDRRIHVDFSQSVAKLKRKGHGTGLTKTDQKTGPQYVLKDRSRQQHQKYNLIFDEEMDSHLETKKKRKHRSHSNSNSSESEDAKVKKNASSVRERRRDSSEVERRQLRERSRRYSSSPETRRDARRKSHSSSDEHAGRSRDLSKHKHKRHKHHRGEGWHSSEGEKRRGEKRHKSSSRHHHHH